MQKAVTSLNHKLWTRSFYLFGNGRSRRRISKPQEQNLKSRKKKQNKKKHFKDEL